MRILNKSFWILEGSGKEKDKCFTPVYKSIIF